MRIPYEIHSIFFICMISIFLFYTESSTPIAQSRCELKLVADYEFYKVIGNKNYANAARYLINLVERINGIFTTIDWGLDVNGNRLVNLGFAIKDIKIYDKPSTHLNHFNSYAQSDVNAIEILRSFSLEEGVNNTCLSILVTAKAFEFGVLGMSNIGSPGQRGICAIDQQDGSFMNTAIITVRRKSDLMMTRVVDLILAHELGHSMGSLHDDIHDEECVPQNSRDGRFVMWESANTGYDKNNYIFSPCSIRSIHRMLYSLAHTCFVEEKGALCGNGILEVGEECDNGAQLNFDEKDECCTTGCKLSKNALCSPRHSECCSKTCNYIPAGELCRAMNMDACKEASYCNGLSERCPEPKLLKDETECTDEGTCKYGECVPFCRSVSPDLLPCLCDNATFACRRCCRSKISGICSPVEPRKWLPENSMCIFGQCIKKICEKTATDSASFFWRFFDNLKGQEQHKFFADYIVFIVVIITLLIWCPCGALIFYKEKQERQEKIKKRTFAENNVQILHERKRVAQK